jgi:lipoate---protein ligase
VSGWDVVELTGSVGEIHGREVPDPPRRSVWIAPVPAPALVLGSAQGDDVVDHSSATSIGVDVLRRRTGGGAVLLWPGHVVWVDVVLPAGDPLWVDDVGASGRWLGSVWAEALRSLGIEAAMVTAGACTSRLSRLVCFAGTGPGEVGLREAKLVGIAQRRTRTAARFQTMVARRWDAATLGRLLRPGLEAFGDGAAEELGRVPVATVDAEPATIVEAFVARLP